jgi:uncharacterized protein YggE
MSRSGITVTAVGTASGPPDRAVLTLGASAIRGEVATALAAVNDKIEKLISTLAGYGIHGPDVQTSNLSIWPEHNTEGAVAGFRVRNTVRITTTAVDALGELIGAATAVLGDLAEIHGLRFEVADPSPLEAQARVRAWSRVHDKARQLADLAGTRLGPAIEVNEGGWYEPGYAMDLASPNMVPVETGGASVDVYLKVRFAQFPDDNTSG